MASLETVANEFTQFYYTTLDGNREGLSGLYRDASFLTFETSQVQGQTAIMEKLKSLPFQKLQHKVETTDFQQGPGGCLLVMVTGKLLVDDSQHPQMFTQSFTLMPEGSSFWVANDLFRLVYG